MGADAGAVGAVEALLEAGTEEAEATGLELVATEADATDALL